jgi:hypothetical protein
MAPKHKGRYPYFLRNRHVTMRGDIIKGRIQLEYDAVLVSDATPSGKEMHYDTTLERIRDYYDIVVDLDNLKKCWKH